MNVTKKIGHDKLWLKIAEGKTWVKLTITRRGVSITSQNCDAIAKDLVGHYQSLKKLKLKHGELIDRLEEIFSGETVR